MRTFFIAVSLMGAAGVLAAAGIAVYSGNWTSTVNSGAGSLKLSVLEPGPKAKCEFSFTTAQSETVKGEVALCKAGAEKIELEYKFDLQGSPLHSRIQGNVKDGKVEGTYRTLGADDTEVDAGNWKATLGQK